jgi:hypothetical protein
MSGLGVLMGLIVLAFGGAILLTCWLMSRSDK